MKQNQNTLRFILVSSVLVMSCTNPPIFRRGDGAVDAPTDRSVTDTRQDTSSDGFVPGAPDVRVVITADNAYAFGWGSQSSVDTLRGRPRFNLCDGFICPADLFSCPIGTGDAGSGPEEYTVPGTEAPEDGYLYIVAWGDLLGTQGVIGQFERQGSTLSTGTDAWEACATGALFDAANPAQAMGPSQTEVNAEIARCNAGTGERTTSSAGWVNSNGAVTANAIGRLAIGEQNMTDRTIGDPILPGNEFPIVCTSSAGRNGVAATARWMWYGVDPGSNAFIYPDPAPTPANFSRQFLIFRVRVGAIIG